MTHEKRHENSADPVHFPVPRLPGWSLEASNGRETKEMRKGVTVWIHTRLTQKNERKKKGKLDTNGGIG
jgi:hypothetical protein